MRSVRIRIVVAAVVLVGVLAAPGPAVARPSLSWAHQFGSDGFDMAWGVVTTPADVYVSGFTTGALPGATGTGGVDGFLVRLDRAGDEVWSRQFGTDGDDLTFGLAMDATGLYVLGGTEGEFDGQTSIGGRDAYLAKFGFDGSRQWVVQFGTTRDDSPSYVAADAGGVYVVGNTAGAFAGRRNRGGEDVFVGRFDANGTQEWVRQFGTRADDIGYAAATGGGDVYLNGFTASHFRGQRSRGQFDAFVARYDAAGHRAWLRQFGTRENELAYGIAVDTTGVYVSGETTGRFDAQRQRGEADAYMRKLSLDGARLWVAQFGTPRYDGCSTVVVDGTSAYCSGRTSGTFAGQTSAGRSDVFVKRLDAATGARGWSLQFGTRADDEANWSAIDAGGLTVVGDTGGRFLGAAALGGGDAFAVSIDPAA